MLKNLFGCVGKYKKVSLLAPFFVICEVILEVIIPYLMAFIIDKGIDAGNMSEIIKYGVILVIATVISLLFGALSGSCAAKASSGFAKNLRQKMFYKLQDFSFSNIDKFSTASLVTRLTTDVTNLQNAYQMIIRVAVRSPSMLIFSLIMAFRVNKSLSLIFLLALPILGVGLYYLLTHAHPIFEFVFKVYDKLNNVVQENLRGIRVVKAFVREDYERKKFEDVSKVIYDKFTKAERLLAFNAPLMQLTSYGCMLLISWFGARLIVTSGATAMTTGELTSLFSYTMQTLMSLMMLSMIFVMLTISRASAQRINEVIVEEPTVKNPKNPVYEVRNGDIEFNDVCFAYNKKPVLKNINLKIRSGETVGIIGGTGSAKTTLVQLIPRIYDITSGSIRVGGVQTKDYDIETLRNEVSMVLQKNILFSGTINENLRWGREDATEEEIKKVCELAQADGFITDFSQKYETYIEQGGVNVSGGQRQRLCIARALLKKPKILILDDSTSAVDTKTDALIRKAFKEEIPDTTKIIIAQRISSVSDADKIIVMNNGCIDAVGTHEELLKNNEIYKEVYNSQMKGGDEE